MRIDVWLKEKYGFSREYSKEIIKAGKISINGKTDGIKPSTQISETDNIEPIGDTAPKYVGRGGLKLEKAIECFEIALKGLVCVDVGASTGGFTDCMLQNGAGKIYAVDVGTSQLADKLKRDPHVISMENTNINDAEIPEKADFVSADVSFVSLKAVIPKIYSVLKEGGGAVLLIKPQFEAGKAHIGKKGIVKDRKIHVKVIKDIIVFASDCGFCVKGAAGSPIKGGSGNIEYLLYLSKEKGHSADIHTDKLVKSVFDDLGRKSEYG